MSQPLTDAEIVSAIRARHLKANVDFYEAHPRWFGIDWKRAYVDGLGDRPYLHVRVFPRSRVGESYIGTKAERIVIRVYPPACLAARIVRRCGYRWGGTWRAEPGLPKGWPGHKQQAPQAKP